MEATSRWWKEERHGVFVDYNQNAKDRTVASAYSVRPTPDARVSAPLRWDEVAQIAIRPRSPSTRCRGATPRSATPARASTRLRGSLDALLELAAADEAAGLPDAPWPPHFEKQAGEQPRVQPSKQRGRPTSADGTAPDVPPPAPGKTSGPTGRRRTAMPLIEIARAASKAEAMAGLERWKERHPDAAALLEPADILVDSMRGRSSTWTRIRLNLRHIPAADRARSGAPGGRLRPVARGREIAPSSCRERGRQRHRSRRPQIGSLPRSGAAELEQELEQAVILRRDERRRSSGLPISQSGEQ